jgi:hypothetical protein
MARNHRPVKIKSMYVQPMNPGDDGHAAFE